MVDSVQSGAESGALGAQSTPQDPGMLAVIDAWPGLPADVRAGILAMIQAATLKAPADE
jgi:hypothetical protein